MLLMPLVTCYSYLFTWLLSPFDLVCPELAHTMAYLDWWTFLFVFNISHNTVHDT